MWRILARALFSWTLKKVCSTKICHFFLKRSCHLPNELSTHLKNILACLELLWPNMWRLSSASVDRKGTAKVCIYCAEIYAHVYKKRKKKSQEQLGWVGTSISLSFPSRQRLKADGLGSTYWHSWGSHQADELHSGCHRCCHWNFPFGLTWTWLHRPGRYMVWTRHIQ